MLKGSQQLGAGKASDNNMHLSFFTCGFTRGIENGGQLLAFLKESLNFIVR